MLFCSLAKCFEFPGKKTLCSLAKPLDLFALLKVKLPENEKCCFVNTLFK